MIETFKRSGKFQLVAKEKKSTPDDWKGVLIENFEFVFVINTKRLVKWYYVPWNKFDLKLYYAIQRI